MGDRDGLEFPVWRSGPHGRAKLTASGAPAATRANVARCSDYAGAEVVRQNPGAVELARAVDGQGDPFQRVALVCA